MIFVPKLIKLSRFGQPKFQRGVLHPVGFWKPAASEVLLITSPGQFASDSGYPGASCTMRFYQVGDGSGRGGEVWELASTLGDTKLADWISPNDETGNFYIQWSSLTGDTPSGWTTAWQKIGGTGSANRSLSLSANYFGNDYTVANFSVALGTDGSTADEGPTSGWTLEADAR